MTRSDFDPLAVVVAWLDACRARRLDELLDFYDTAATLECGCDGPYIHRGRADIARYWSSRLEAAVPDAFRLTNILPGDEPDNAVLDYTDYTGNGWQRPCARVTVPTASKSNPER